MEYKPELFETIIKLGEVDLIQQKRNQKYYFKRDADGCMFDISNNWKSSQKNKFITNASRTYLINSIRRLHEKYPQKEGLEKFLKWYDNYNASGTTQEIKPSEDKNNKSESSNTSSNTIVYDNKNLEAKQEETNNLLKILNKQLQESNNFVRTNIIEVLADKMLSLKADEVAGKITNSVDKYIKENYGVLPQKYEFKLPDGTTTTGQGIYHKELPNIMKFIVADIPIMLTGPAGSGKNYTLEKAAEMLKLDFYFSNAITQEYKLTGFIDANGKYQETQFYKAFKNGGVFFLDEMDASIPEALIILNAAIANKYFDFPVGRITAHKDFRVVAAANTFGTGSDIVYVGRNVLDGATLDRFAVVRFDYDPKVEMSLCPNKDLYDFIKSIRDAVEAKQLRYVISVRAMINAYKMLQSGFSKEYIIKTAIMKSMSIDDVKSIYYSIKSNNNEWNSFLARAYDIG